MRKNGFTLIELIAVIVILGIILAIAVPSIIGVISNSTKAAFESDAKLLLKAIDYKKLEDASFSGTNVNQSNIDDLLGLSNDNYNSIKIINKDDTLIVTIVGKNKWDGLVACGTFKSMSVVTSTSDCSNDLIPPVITVLGDNPTNIFIDSIYIDAGATAIDDKDGDVTDKIITTGSINPNVPSSYTITYTVSDSAGNERVMTRTVNVIDNKGPIITLMPNGNNNYAKSNSTKVTVIDLGGIDESSLKYVWTTSNIEPTSNQFLMLYENNQIISTPLNASGSYYLWVMAFDTTSNKTIMGSNVFNLDNEKSVITINGNTNVTINKGSSYIDAGATVTDNIDTNITVTSTGTVNPNVVGSYTITYNATDTAGNIANPVTRTVTVVDVSAPVITILGSNLISIEYGSTYTDAGATALDDVDGNVTSRITKTSTVNPSVLGTYTVTYSVSDNAGNRATASRTVNVIDSHSPIVTANAGSYTIIQGVSNAIPGTYFTISSNGPASISSTTCIDTSNGNTTVTNTSSLAVGTHAIKCTVTKSTGLTSNATTNVIVNPAYTCATGTLTNDPTKGYICVINASSSSTSECTKYDSIGRPSYSETYLSCGDGSFSDSSPGFFVYVTCSPTGYTESCGNNSYSCTLTDFIYACLEYSTSYNYYCPSGWSNYTGSGGSLSCYKAAIQG